MTVEGYIIIIESHIKSTRVSNSVGNRLITEIIIFEGVLIIVHFQREDYLFHKMKA